MTRDRGSPVAKMQGRFHRLDALKIVVYYRSATQLSQIFENCPARYAFRQDGPAGVERFVRASACVDYECKLTYDYGLTVMVPHDLSHSDSAGCSPHRSEYHRQSRHAPIHPIFICARAP